MLKKLRVRLVLLTTAALLVLLAVIVLTSSILNYQELTEDADNIIASLTKVKDTRWSASDEPPQSPSPSRSVTLETPYESRYFIVTLDEEDETILSIDTDHIVSVSQEMATDYARAVLSQQDEAGFQANFRYNVAWDGSTITIVFLEYSRYLDTFVSTVRNTCLISLLCFAVVTVLLILFSGRILKPVAESYEKQRQFITAAGHEIKTPLTIIDADAEILAMDMVENEWLQDIQSQTQRLASLTNDLISLSRMDEEAEDFQMIEFPLSDIVIETAASFQILAASRGIALTLKVQPNLSLEGDESAIQRLVSILLDNAVKYAAGEDPIVLTLTQNAQSICLSVSNPSDPVTPEQLSRFFDRFYRTENSRNAETGGYGLGLAIAKSITEAHKGRIAVSSPDPRHVQVTVTLPQSH